MNFGAAISALSEGKMVFRTGWNGKDMFIFKQVSATISTDVIPNMQSLPGDVKAEFPHRNQSIYYDNQLALVKPDNSISGWSPSTEDALASDWEIKEAPAQATSSGSFMPQI